MASPAVVSELEVALTSGTTALPADSTVQLKIYADSPVPRVFTLSRGTAWPAGATRIVPLRLDRPLAIATVRRFAISLSATHGGSPATWDVSSAVVEWSGPEGRARLLGANLSGVVAAGRDLASADQRDADLRCNTDADCDNGLECDGVERCLPGDSRADARGCVAGRPPVCPVNQVCSERKGCHGLVTERAPAAR